MQDDGNSVFQAKKQYLYSKIWEFGANVVNGSKFLVENVIWNRRSRFAYSLYNFYGATMMIKGSLLLSAPIVKHFQAERMFSKVEQTVFPASITTVRGATIGQTAAGIRNSPTPCKKKGKLSIGNCRGISGGICAGEM